VTDRASLRNTRGFRRSLFEQGDGSLPAAAVRLHRAASASLLACSFPSYFPASSLACAPALSLAPASGVQLQVDDPARVVVPSEDRRGGRERGISFLRFYSTHLPSRIRSNPLKTHDRRQFYSTQFHVFWRPNFRPGQPSKTLSKPAPEFFRIRTAQPCSALRGAGKLFRARRHQRLQAASGVYNRGVGVAGFASGGHAWRYAQ